MAIFALLPRGRARQAAVSGVRVGRCGWPFSQTEQNMGCNGCHWIPPFHPKDHGFLGGPFLPLKVGGSHLKAER